MDKARLLLQGLCDPDLLQGQLDTSFVQQGCAQRRRREPSLLSGHGRLGVLPHLPGRMPEAPLPAPTGQ